MRRWKRRALWAAVLFGVLLAVPATVAHATRSLTNYAQRRTLMRKLVAVVSLVALAAVVGTGTLAFELAD